MISIRKKRLVITALALVPAGLAAQDTTRSISRDSALWVQGVESKRGKPIEQDPAHAFEQHLFPPELVMRHQARLRLSESQRNFIVGEITKLQATAVQVQWRVGDEAEKLTELLQRETVAEAEALAQADRMIMNETAVKRAQLSMLIRIRNALTPEQRAMLQELRRPKGE